MLWNDSNVVSTFEDISSEKKKDDFISFLKEKSLVPYFEKIQKIIIRSVGNNFNFSRNRKKRIIINIDKRNFCKFHLCFEEKFVEIYFSQK